MRVYLNENNSGGYWWLDSKDYEKLFAAGWQLREGWDEVGDSWLRDPREPWLDNEENPVPYGWRHGTVYLETTSVEAAMDNFQDVTGNDPDAQGCRCCGQPFYFSDFGY